jgi:galactose mutarotase-like enzyme
MPLSLGFHPYFALSERLKETAKGLTLALSARRSFSVTAVGGQGDIFDQGPINRVDVSTKAYQNAIIEMVSHKPIYFSGKEQGTRTVLRTEGPLNYTVLWGEPDSKFFCIEPWMAPPDAPHHEHGTSFLADGEGLSVAFFISEEYLAC